MDGKKLLVGELAQELHQLDGLVGGDHDIPAGELGFQLALEHGDLAGQQESAALDLVLDVVLGDELGDGGRGQLAGCPGCIVFPC